MNSDGDNRPALEEQITPHLDVLLAVSFGMTKNGRDATKLTREVVAKARQTWDDSLVEINTRMWLHEILTNQFFNGFVRYARPLMPIQTDKRGHGSLRLGRLNLGPVSLSTQKALAEAELTRHRLFSNAIHNLTEAFRPVMTLSFLKGFNTGDIAELASVRPHKITSLLQRGSTLVRQELFDLLLDKKELAPNAAELRVIDGLTRRVDNE